MRGCRGVYAGRRMREGGRERYLSSGCGGADGEGGGVNHLLIVSYSRTVHELGKRHRPQRSHISVFRLTLIKKGGVQKNGKPFLLTRRSSSLRKAKGRKGRNS